MVDILISSLPYIWAATAAAVWTAYRNRPADAGAMAGTWRGIVRALGGGGPGVREQ